MPVYFNYRGSWFFRLSFSGRVVDSAGHRVICMDNLITGSLANIEHLFGREDFRFFHHDVTDFIHVPGPIDNILHFASPGQSY